MRPEEVVIVVFRREQRRAPEFLVALRVPERHGYWHLIAGGVEPGELPSEAARRELREETTLETVRRFEPVELELGYTRADGSRARVHPFLAEAPRGWEPTLDDEHADYRWCSRDEADALLAYPEPRAAVARVADLLEDELG
jgi:dATP pyrophosphohydrolase